MTRKTAAFGAALLLLALACHLPGLTPPDAGPTTEPGPPLPEPTATAAPADGALPSPSPTPTLEPPSDAQDNLGPFRLFSPPPPAEALRGLWSAPDGTLWVSADSGLLALDRAGWTQHPYPDALVLGFDGSGRIWITPDDGQSVATSNGTLWRAYEAADGWTAPPERLLGGDYPTVADTIVTDRRGVLWVVTLRDVRTFQDGTWRVMLPTETGFTPTDTMVEMGFEFGLTDVAIDSAGDVWVADCAWGGPGPLGNGARWFNGSTWEGATSTVIGTGCVADVEIDATGRIWLGVEGDLWRFTPGSGWDELPHPSPELPDGVRWGWISNLVLEPDGRAAWVTVGLCGGASCGLERYLLYHVTDAGWAQISEDAPFSVGFDARGLAWVCDGQGLLRVEGDVASREVADPELGCRVSSDRGSHLWLIRSDRPGLWHVQP